MKNINQNNSIVSRGQVFEEFCNVVVFFFFDFFSSFCRNSLDMCNVSDCTHTCLVYYTQHTDCATSVCLSTIALVLNENVWKKRLCTHVLRVQLARKCCLKKKIDNVSTRA